MTIDWQEMTAAVNNIIGTEYPDDVAMLTDLYHKRGSLSSMAQVLGLSRSTIAKQMNRRHILRAGHHGGYARTRMRILAIPECKRSTMIGREIAARAKCSLRTAYRFQSQTR